MDALSLYSNKILDPKSRSVAPHDNYFICKCIGGKWHIIEGAYSDRVALQNRDILANHDLKNGHITSLSEYKVFKKGLNPIKTTLD